MTPLRLACAAAALAALTSNPALAGDLFAVRQDQQEIYRIDSNTFAVALVGPYQLASPGEFAINALAFGRDGTLFGISSSFSNASLYTIDQTTGAATQIAAIGPANVLSFDRDPADDSFWWASTGASHPTLVRLDPVTLTPSVQGTMNISISEVWGLAFGPSNLVHIFEGPSNQMWAMDKHAPQDAFSLPFGLGMQVWAGASLTADETYEDFVGYSVLDRALYQVNATTGADQLLHKFPAGTPLFWAVAGRRCGGFVQAYGAGCAGSGGFVPALAASGCVDAGQTLEVSLESGLGGSSAVLLFGQGAASIPIGGGVCSLNVAPLLPLVLTVPLGGAGPGAGSFALAAEMPSLPLGTVFTMQAFVPDPASFIGATASNGVLVIVQ